MADNTPRVSWISHPLVAPILALGSLLVTAVWHFPTVQVITIVAFAVLLAKSLFDAVHWSDRISTSTRIWICAGTALIVIAVGVPLVLKSAADPASSPSVHITTADGIVKREGNRYRVFANIHIVNDGPAAIVNVYQSDQIASTPANKDQFNSYMEKLWAVADGPLGAPDNPVPVGQGEHHFFTAWGPFVDDSTAKQIEDGRLTFYFVGAIEVKTANETRRINYCKFYAGGAVVDCPDASAAART